MSDLQKEGEIVRIDRIREANKMKEDMRMKRRIRIGRRRMRYGMENES